MKQKVQVEYVKSGSNESKSYTIHPYHLVFRENELYLLLLDEKDRMVKTFAVYRIKNLKITDEHFTEDGPDVNEYYRHTLGAFTGDRVLDVELKVKNEIVGTVKNVLSNLELGIKSGNDGTSTFTFKVRDPKSLCKQLFFYGNDVEVVGSPEVREVMKGMIEKVRTIY